MVTNFFMRRKFILFLAVYIALIAAALFVSFYFGYDPVTKSFFFKLFFVLGVCYLPAAILALIFRETLILKDLPFYIAGLAAVILLAVIIPAVIKKERANKIEWENEFASASRDFVCPGKSFISFIASDHRLIKYSEQSGDENITIVGDISENNKDLKPFFGNAASVDEFKLRYAGCKNKDGRTIFDVYTFKPDPYDIEMMQVKK